MQLASVFICNDCCDRSSYIIGHSLNSELGLINFHLMSGRGRAHNTINESHKQTNERAARRETTHSDNSSRMHDNCPTSGLIVGARTRGRLLGLCLRLMTSSRPIITRRGVGQPILRDKTIPTTKTRSKGCGRGKEASVRSNCSSSLL